MKIAVDTETTGLSIHQKDVPFLVMAVEDREDGSDLTERIWEIEIDPTRRKWIDSDENDAVILDCDDYFRSIEEETNGEVEWIFHNGPFDLHALEQITTYFVETFSLKDDSLRRIHDTLPLSHVYDNLGTHGLKELGMSYLAERPSQRDEVKEAVKAIRRHAKHIEGVVVGSVAEEDYWLPSHVAKYVPELIARIAPAIAPTLRLGKTFWKSGDEKLYSRKRLTEEEQDRVDTQIAAVRTHLVDVAARYGIQDVHLTLKLFYILEGMLDEDSHREGLWKTYDRERRVMWQIYSMQRRGIRLKPQKLPQKIEEFENRIGTQTSNLRRLSGNETLNPESSQQLQRVFYGNDGASLRFEPIKLTDSGAPSCDKEVVSELLTESLNQLSDRDRDIVLDAGTTIPWSFEITSEEFEARPLQERLSYELYFRRAVFLRALSDRKAHSAALGYLRSYYELGSTRSYPYAVPMKDTVENRIWFDVKEWLNKRDPCLYGNWNASGTGTSRLSSSHPNTQNWSKGKPDDFDEGQVKATIRDIFGPDKGDLWFSIDYSQLQVRIFAYLSGDRALIDILEAGGDTHTEIAKIVYDTDSPSKNQRRKCKPITFGTLFGAGPDRVAYMSGIENGYALFMGMFPNGKKFIDDTVAFARRHGFVVLPDGSRLNVPRDRIYAAFCYMIQGMEAVIVKEAMVALELALAGTPMRSIYQVHDEMGFEFLNPFRHLYVGPKLSVEERRLKTSKVVAKCVEIAQTTMEQAGANYEMLLPVEVEWTDTNLGDLKKWESYSSTKV